MAFHDVHVENSWSLAIWLKPGRDTADETILDLRSDGSNENRIRVEKLGTVSNDPLQISLYDSAGTLFKQYRYESVVPVGDWELVVFTWNGTTLTAYVGGASVAASSTPTNNAGTMSSTARSVTVGVDYAHTAYYQGYVHAIGLWSVVLGATEVTKLYNSPLLWWRRDADDYTSGVDLQHWWRLGESTRNDFEGTSWVVDAGYAVDGIDLSIGSVNVTDADIVAEIPLVTYVSGTSLNMLGASSYLANTTNTDLGIANAFTIALSFCRDDASMGGGVGCYVDIKNTGSNANRIQIGNSPSGTSRINVVLYDSAGTKFKDYGFSNVNTGNGGYWHTIVISWDGTSLVCAINGLVVAQDATTTDAAGTMTNTNRAIYCGANATPTEANSLLHTLALWDEALTSSEKEQLWNIGSSDVSVDYGNYASSANLVHYWRAGVPAAGSQSGTTYVCDYLGGAGVDIAANAVGMSDADILNEGPYDPAVYAHALDFDGSSYMLTNGDVSFGPSGEWTLKFTVYSDIDSADETILHCKPTASSISQILVQKLGTVANDPLRILVSGSGGAAYKDYRWDSVIPSGSWKTFVLVLSSAADTMVLYDETGSVLTPTTLTTDSVSTTSNQARTIAIGANTDGTNKFNGRIRQIAWWLDNWSAGVVADLAGHNVDLHRATTNYPFTSAGVGTLHRWWLLGVPNSTVVRLTNAVDWVTDYNVQGNNNLDWSSSVNMSAADIVAEIPV